MRAPETQNVEGRNPVPVTKLLVWIRTPRSDWFRGHRATGRLGPAPSGHVLEGYGRRALQAPGSWAMALPI